MKRIVSLFMFMFLAAGAANAACDRELGACRISDLKNTNPVQEKTVNRKVLPAQKETPKVKVKEEKPTFKQFIVSLLKPSE